MRVTFSRLRNHAIHAEKYYQLQAFWL